MPCHDDKYSCSRQLPDPRQEIDSDPENLTNIAGQTTGNEKTRFDEFEEFLQSIDAETHARAAALANDPNYRPPAADLLDDPDPFGMDWEWAKLAQVRAELSPDQNNGKK
jgi:hypothetical protein